MSANTATPSPPGEMIVGIDLGTTHSLVAYCDESGPHCIADEQGRTLLPSVVRYDPAGGQVAAIGYEARRHAVEYPLTTLFSIKRLMGRGIEDVQGELAYLPYPVVAGDHHTARVRLGDDAQARVVSPQEVSAVILAELRRWATRHFGRPVRKAVITVPAYFDDAQRQATRDAGRLAGLEVVRIVNEPTAASLAYNLGRHAAQAGRGESKSGGSLAEKRADGTITLNTKINPAVCTSGPDATAPATAASTPTNASGAVGSGGGGETVAVFDLGGGTFDFSILKLQTTAAGVVDQVLGTAGDTHLGGDDVDRMIVELIQQEIRTQFGSEIEFPPATRQAFRNLAEATKIRLSDHDQSAMEIDLGGGRQYRRTLTKGELETMMTPWVDKALACCRTALQRANLPATAMQRVILVGGSTRAPLVRQRVREYFQSEPYTALNPDEVVALGAAVQAAILAGVHRGMLLLDVIPLSLGIETLGGAVAKLIVANTTIPARATEKFTTYVDGQTKVSIHVLQGERELVQDCRSLGRFDLTGVPPMPAGLPKIEVTFLVDANGVLNVSAIEQRSGKAASLQVVPNHGLTREEVARMEAQSLAHAKEDMDAHRLIDLRNQARLDMRNIERQLARVGKNLDADTRAKIDAAMNKVREFTAAAAPNADEFYQVLTDMDHATIRLAELAIKQSLTEEGLMEAPKSE